MMVDQSYSVKVPHDDNSWSVGDGMLRLTKHMSSRGEPWWMGEFVHANGIVSIIRESTFTRLDFAHLGRAYNRTWHTHFGDRTVARLARAFVSDVLDGRVK